MTWKAPPILDDPDRTVTRNGRKLRLYYDGGTPATGRVEDQEGASTGSRTRSRTAIGEAQMIEIAASLKRLKQ